MESNLTRGAARLELSFENLLVLVSVFLVSLGSFYFYSIGLYLFQLVGLFAALVLCKRWPTPITSTSLSVLALFLLLAYSYDAILLIVGVNFVTGGRLFLPILFCLCYWFACAILLSPKKFIWGLKIVIVIHGAIFLVQFFVYLFFGYFIDFLEPMTGEEQRAFGGTYEISVLTNFIRGTGLYNEPGTYSTYMMLLLVLVKDLEQISNLRSTSKLVELVVLITVMLSFSNFGFIFVALYLIFEFAVKPRSRSILNSKLSRVFLNISLIGAVAFCALIFYQYVQQRFFLSNEAIGIEFRLFGLTSIAGDVSWIELFFGKGFSAPVETYDGSPLPIQDIGFWFGIYYYCGIFGLLVLAWCLTSSIRWTLRDVRGNSYFFCLMLLLLLCKLGFTNPIVLVILIYAALRGAAMKRYQKSKAQNLLQDKARGASELKLYKSLA